VFRHHHEPGGLYNPFYQYFLSRWNDPDIPEYDLDTDELVYRDRSNKEVRRVLFNEVTFTAGDEDVLAAAFSAGRDLVPAEKEHVYA